LCNWFEFVNFVKKRKVVYILMKNTLISIFFLFFLCRLQAQEASFDSYTGMFASGGMHIIRFENLNNDLQDLSCETFIVPISSYGGGLYTGSLSSRFYTTADLYLFKQIRQSPLMNESKLYGLNALAHIYGTIYKSTSTKLNAYTGAGVSVLYLLIRTPNNQNYAPRRHYDAIPQQISQNLAAVYTTGISVDKILGLYRQKITDNKLIISLRLGVSIPLSYLSLEKSLFHPEIRVEKPYPSLSLTLGRIKHKNIKTLLLPPSKGEGNTPPMF